MLKVHIINNMKHPDVIKACDGVLPFCGWELDLIPLNCSCNPLVKCFVNRFSDSMSKWVWPPFSNIVHMKGGQTHLLILSENLFTKHFTSGLHEQFSGIKLNSHPQKDDTPSHALITSGCFMLFIIWNSNMHICSSHIWPHSGITTFCRY